ncbi:MAG: hypothetical protein WDO18_05265 [Acidobacteriota bacterium]
MEGKFTDSWRTAKSVRVSLLKSAVTMATGLAPTAMGAPEGVNVPVPVPRRTENIFGAVAGDEKIGEVIAIHIGGGDGAGGIEGDGLRGGEEARLGVGEQSARKEKGERAEFQRKPPWLTASLTSRLIGKSRLLCWR